MIVDYKQIYPSGTATAHLINSFHTPQGAKLAKKQVKALGRFFTFSFLWGFFQWFYTAADECGFRQFPSFGLEAHKNMFYFVFTSTYVGVGMICPYIVNISLLVGSILSWGIMWPLIATRKGDCYLASESSSSLHGLQGYRVFIAIAMILGDGLYNFFMVMSKSVSAFIQQLRKGDSILIPVADSPPPATVSVSYDDQRRAELFLKDQIPLWLAVGGYIAVAAVSIGTLPQIFPQLKWYYVFVSYIFAPVLAFCNAYGAGLTDWSLSSAAIHPLLSASKATHLHEIPV
ncbi:putative metal-nicotianamine transporter ysl12 [Asimina triloba]